jgi:leucyl aminopeptidase
MTPALSLIIKSSPSRLPQEGDLVVFTDGEGQITPGARALLGDVTLAHIARAAKIENFRFKARSVLVLPCPSGLDVDRLIVAGTGPEKETGDCDWTAIGGVIMSKLKAETACLLTEDLPEEAVRGLLLGLQLRAYKFDRHKTKKKDEDETDPRHLVFSFKDSDIFRRCQEDSTAIAEGVILARDLVNAPPNLLGPEEFAAQAQELSSLGVEVTILDDTVLHEIGMRALLGVAQGSIRPARVALMHWRGGNESEAPLAIIGKGVVFDSGGISIKPAANMEDMKGDMGGAACVVGLLHTLARRSAKANVLGVIGLVENMPDGAAQRPGDIVTTLSGQTVEIINTDAEGRLVLADLLWHVRETYKPCAMINLATLTGAILIALGQDHAGLFANDDALAAELAQAGEVTGERIWRLPLRAPYDKMIDSKFADMKNTGGRFAGAITAAQFLKRFVGDTPWAHLDIAGTAMSAPQTDINQSWGSGWGVRLLDALVRKREVLSS